MGGGSRRHVLAITIFASLVGMMRSAFAQTPRFARVADLRKLVIAALKGRPGVSEVTADSRDPAKIHTKVRDSVVTSDVTNLFGLLNAYPDTDVNELIERFISPVLQGPVEAAGTVNILPVLRDRAYVDTLTAGRAQPVYEPFGAGLFIVYMADSADAMSAVDQSEVPGMSAASLRPIALENLEKWLGKLHVDDSVQGSVLYNVDGNELLAPSLLLSEKFWAAIAGRFPKGVLIAIPRRDQLFIFDADLPGAENAARRLIAATWKEGFNLLSDQLYTRRNGRIVLA